MAVVLAATACAHRPIAGSPGPPEDRPVTVTTEASRDRLFEAMKPYVAQARRTYPEARERFLRGLPQGSSFFLIVRLADAQQHVEQVFVKVDRIEGSRVTGRIWNDLSTVSGYSQGQVYEFPEEEMLDWLISNPDGSEEGNFVGRFLDDWQDSGP